MNNIIFSIDQINDIAKNFIEKITKDISDTKATTIYLNGPLGAGKTTLIKEICALLGVREHVSSPTFTLINHYLSKNSAFKDIYHIDVYRIEPEDNLAVLRLDDIFNKPKTLILIEWAERLKSLPNPDFLINLDHESEEKRIIRF